MQTNFFSQIKQLNVTGNLRLNIQPQENGELIVSLLLDTTLIKDKAAKLIPPLMLKGSDSELDTGFFDAIEQPVQSTETLLLNMQAHTAAMEKAQKESRMVKDQEDAKKKEKEGKRKKFDELMKKVDELEKQKKVGEAIGQLPDLKQFPEFEVEIKKKAQELRSQHGTLSLFGEDSPAETNPAAAQKDEPQAEDNEEQIEEEEEEEEPEEAEDNDPEDEED